MAQPPPYPGQSAVPPPYGGVPAYPTQGIAAPPPAVYVQPAPAPVPVPAQEKKPEKKGMWGSFMKEVDKVGKQLGKELDSAGKKVSDVVNKNYSSSLMDLFKHGNVVQLVSRSSGKTVQIVVGATGMILDGNGPLDPSAFNSLWTVINDGNNQVKLQNYNNYMAVIDGQAKIVTVPPGVMPGLETRFQLSQSQHFVSLESLHERTRHLGFVRTGELKPALATTKDEDGQFGVKLVASAYPVMTPVAAPAPTKACKK